MKRALSFLALCVVAILPWAVKRHVYSRLFGFRIGAGAYVGISLVDTDVLELGAGARIAHLTNARHKERIILGDRARIGTFNWIAGYRDPARTYFADRPQRESTLELGSDAAITARHLIDCIDRISIGSFTTVAGHRSQLLTHAIDFREGKQDCSPIVIGERCFIGTGCIILKGAEIADRVIVAAGSVVTGSLKEQCSIYGGNPAVKFRSIDADAKYFTRSVGMV